VLVRVALVLVVLLGCQLDRGSVGARGGADAGTVPDTGPGGRDAGRVDSGRVDAGGGCVPRAESCNGADDDCDGTLDEDSDSLVPCTAGIDCAGVSRCVSGEVACVAEMLDDERCNGADDDCDGTVDEAPTDVGMDCGSGTGVCAARWVCVGGVRECAAVSPEAEICDGVDNDCDDDVDERPMDVGEACFEGADDFCAGSTVCEGGTRVCNVSPVDEACDGNDNDCDGVVDEDVILGDCTRAGDDGHLCTGRNRCIAGTPSCVIETPETCNGVDDDCDGMTDEGTASGDESCNDVDDDCDGSIDEGLSACASCDVVTRPGGSTYALCRKVRRWGPAREWCAGRGMRIVRIDDAAEQTWLAGAVESADPGPRNSWWIGLRDVVGGGDGSADEYRWHPDDDTTPPPGYDAWASGEPNTNNGCARMANDEGAARLWTDRGCGETFHFVCESL